MKKKPREIVKVPYAEGDKMLRGSEGWRLAPEEDKNNDYGYVFLERDIQDDPGAPSNDAYTAEEKLAREKWGPIIILGALIAAAVGAYLWYRIIFK